MFLNLASLIRLGLNKLHLIQALLRAGEYLIKTSATLLPVESMKHFASAGSEFTHGLARLAHPLPDIMDSIEEGANMDLKQEE